MIARAWHRATSFDSDEYANDLEATGLPRC